MEIIGCRLHRQHLHVIGQVAVQRLAELLRRQGRVHLGMGHLAPGMDPGISAPSAPYGNPLAAQHLAKGRFQISLHRALILLHLPAMKSGAIIGHHQLQVYMTHKAAPNTIMLLISATPSRLRNGSGVSWPRGTTSP